MSSFDCPEEILSVRREAGYEFLCRVNSVESSMKKTSEVKKRCEQFAEEVGYKLDWVFHNGTYFGFT